MSEKELFFFYSSKHLSAFIKVSDKIDKFNDSSGFCHSFLHLEQILSFMPISNIDRKDSCKIFRFARISLRGAMF